MMVPFTRTSETEVKSGHVTKLQPDQRHINGQIVTVCDARKMPSIACPIAGYLCCPLLGTVAFVNYKNAKSAQGNCFYDFGRKGLF